jgi:hypothetical protein
MTEFKVESITCVENHAGAIFTLNYTGNGTALISELILKFLELKKVNADFKNYGGSITITVTGSVSLNSVKNYLNH